MPIRSDNSAYLEYLRDHPELLETEPPHAAAPAFWGRLMAEGRCTGREMDRSVATARRRWERFHLETARSLGFEITIQTLLLDMASLFGPAGSRPRSAVSERQRFEAAPAIRNPTSAS